MRKRVDSFPSNINVSLIGGLIGPPATAILSGCATFPSFPSIFSKFDSLQKNYYHTKSSKLISQDLEDGEIIANYNKNY